MTPPTTEEIEGAAEVLRRLTPGFLPLPIFREVARLCTTPTVELVPLRRNGDQIEILLCKRPDDDPNWPSQLHTPGTVIRATDAGDGFSKPFERLYDDEIGVHPATKPQVVTQILHKVARGTEVIFVFYIDLTGVETPMGEWHPVDPLPDSIVETQRKFIAQAVQAFEGGAHK